MLSLLVKFKENRVDSRLLFQVRTGAARDHKCLWGPGCARITAQNRYKIELAVHHTHAKNQ